MHVGDRFGRFLCLRSKLVCGECKIPKSKLIFCTKLTKFLEQMVYDIRVGLRCLMPSIFIHIQNDTFLKKCFEFPCVPGAQMTNPKHEELVLRGIASNFQTPFDFFSDFHFKYLGVSFPNSGYSTLPILILC